MRWKDDQSSMELELPAHFSFSEALIFLGRSSQEILHYVEGSAVFKGIIFDGEVILLKLSSTETHLQASFLLGPPSHNGRKKAAAFIEEWLDLKRDASGFVRMSARDPLLKSLAERYGGLRIIGIPDLFEALVWAVIGQQINLTFAYKLKKAFTEKYGTCFPYQGRCFWLFPEPGMIAGLEPEELKQLQFTGRKAEYIIGIAKLMAEKKLKKDDLLGQPGARDKLISLKGVGAWTADYVRMKCLLDPSAFPIGDAGLQNALKQQMGLDRKPSIEEIEKAASRWAGWQAYAVFYFWRSLYE
ncbi:DNA-3-methyladenine glycosylase family protein [Bacillus infantis]|uniref:DNA-3-methyladenine glycosylase II n=1 Tax=Bacillus infantis TaxID=324767 RepID=A0A5D4R7J5_9BACI|nr:DNA glycosylase [Bacillus infantis]TYS45946.1 DNA-3-methyladenine glycosylase 2 family protein [Bacillus infantis]